MLNLIFYVLVGLGAGIINGLAGLSAALVVTPVLFALCGWNAYDAITVALAAGVPASLLSASTYYKNGNVDIKRGGAVTITAFLGSIIGSLCGYLLSRAQSNSMGDIALLFTLEMGVRLLVQPILGGEAVPDRIESNDQKRQTVQVMIRGLLIGWICGFTGSGAGLMMLTLFTKQLRCDLKTSVGTSTMVMAAVSLTGVLSHFVMGARPDLLPASIIILCCVLATRGTAKFANRIDDKVLNRVIGAMLLLMSTAIILSKLQC